MTIQWREVLIMDLVVAFGEPHLMGVESDWMEDSLEVSLGQDCGGYKSEASVSTVPGSMR